MYQGKRHIYKDDVFKLQCSGTDSVARMYQNKRFVTFKRDNLRYLMNMLYLVQDQQSRYILARDDVVAYALLARDLVSLLNLSLLFVDSYCTNNCFMKSKHCSYKTIVWQRSTVWLLWNPCYVLCSNKSSLVWLVVAFSFLIPDLSHKVFSSFAHNMYTLSTEWNTNTDGIRKSTHQPFKPCLGTRSHSVTGLQSAEMAHYIVHSVHTVQDYEHLTRVGPTNDVIMQS
jgi:hypothetical protein